MRLGRAFAIGSPILLMVGCAKPCVDDGLIQRACPADGAGNAPDGTDGPFAEGGFIDPGNDSGSGGVDTTGVSTGGDSGDDSSGEPPDADADADADGVPDDVDNCPAFANPNQVDDDDDGLGDACDLDVPCGLGMSLRPLLVPDADIEFGTEGVCPGCTVEDAPLAIDRDFTTHGILDTPVGTLGSSYIHVRDGAMIHPGGTRVGFVLDGFAGVALADVLLALEITTTLDGEEQEGAGDLDVQTPDVANGRVLILLQTTADYDGVRLAYGTPGPGLAPLEVYAACFEEP